jgi:hypothetical protein
MSDSTPPIELHYRISFLAMMLAVALVLITAGPIILIGSIVLFRPAASFLGVILTMTGVHMLRRYKTSFIRRQAAYQFDRQGIHYTAQNGSTKLWFTDLKIPLSYTIPWSTVLGIHVVRRPGREMTDIYFYLSDNPFSSLFWGETDPRAAVFGGHHPEAPNQLHLRFNHFDMSHFENDLETSLRNFAPRMGAFPNGAKILLGHLAALNMMTFVVMLTITFGAVIGIIIGLAGTWPIALLAFALFQCLALPVPIFRRLAQRNPGWETPRLISTNGTLYVPGSALGQVQISDILNVRYGLTGLRFIFTSCQDDVQNFQYNPYGLVANVMILTKGKTRERMAQYFSDGNIWDNGKKPDIQKARAQKKLDDEKSKRESIKSKQREAARAQAKQDRQHRE